MLPPKPVPIPINVSGIPEELKERDQWVLWKYAPNAEQDDWTKLPLTWRNGRMASSIESRTWGTFKQVLGALDRLDADGIGFVVSRLDPYTGIDLDKCRNAETGEVDQWAVDLIEEMDSFTEVSPSGTGIRIWIIGSVIGLVGTNGKGEPKAGIRTNKPTKIEIYSAERFLTVTGQEWREAA